MPRERKGDKLKEGMCNLRSTSKTYQFVNMKTDFKFLSATMPMCMLLRILFQKKTFTDTKKCCYTWLAVCISGPLLWQRYRV